MMAAHAEKTTAQLQQEIMQLEEKASKQQKTATSYEQALRHSEERLVEAERHWSLQQAHLHQLRADVQIKSDSARDAFEAASARRKELDRRAEMAKEHARHTERRKDFLTLDDHEIGALALQAIQNPSIMRTYRNLVGPNWSIEDLQTCQSLIWQTVVGSDCEGVIRIIQRAIASIDAEDDDVVVVASTSNAGSAARSLLQRKSSTASTCPPARVKPPATSPYTMKPCSQRAETPVSIMDDRPSRTRHDSAPSPHLRSPRKDLKSVSPQPSIHSSVTSVDTSPRWDVLPPSRSKRPRILNGGDFFKEAAGKEYI